MRSMLAVLLFLSTELVVAEGAGEKGVTRWLPIVATQSSVNHAFASAIKLQRNSGELLLVETSDCHNLRKRLYVVVAGIQGTRVAAESAITKWRKQGIDDAYLRRCEVVVPSRLSIGIPLLDPSFMRNQIEAVNWGLEDAVSDVVALSDHWVAFIIPRYEADPDDIREGLRIGVRLYSLETHRSLDLSSDCIDPEFALNATHVALTCVNETAATYLLHRTQLYALMGGRVVAEESRCVKPTFEQGRWICQKESVDAEGNLGLKSMVMTLN